MGYYVCGIYDKRPEMCRKYPERDSYIPEQCSFSWDAEGVRRGECDPECGATCCLLPRLNGEPGAAAMPEIAGGLPCRHLVYSETHPAMSGERKEDTVSEEDRGGDRPEPNPLELALAEIDRRKGDRSSLEEMGGGGRSGKSGT